MTDDLEGFLRARLDEEASAAQSALRNPEFCTPGGPTVGSGLRLPPMGQELLVDPARLLAEVQAKSAILDLHAALDDAGWITCTECFDPHGTQCPEYPCETVCLLALPYADHPDYRQEWRP